MGSKNIAPPKVVGEQYPFLERARCSFPEVYKKCRITARFLHPGREICHQCICDGHKAWAFGNPWWCGDPRSRARKSFRSFDEWWWIMIHPSSRTIKQGHTVILSYWHIETWLGAFSRVTIVHWISMMWLDTRIQDPIKIYGSMKALSGETCQYRSFQHFDLMITFLYIVCRHQWCEGLISRCRF